VRRDYVPSDGKKGADQRANFKLTHFRNFTGAAGLVRFAACEFVRSKLLSTPQIQAL
jgi:hypothetical protein